MNVLTDYISFEETIKGSRFLSELFVCDSQQKARDLIKEQKIRFADATHVVHAFVIGKGAEVLGMSDDGEPSGTAGRPALDVLKGFDCTNVVLTITRWFGGTLLGTGGLVKAYSGGAKAVLEKARDAGLIQPLVEKTSFDFSCEYSLYKLIKNKMISYNIFNLSEEFGENVRLSGQIQASQSDDFFSFLSDASNGKIQLK